MFSLKINCTEVREGGREGDGGGGGRESRRQKEKSSLGTKYSECSAPSLTVQQEEKQVAGSLWWNGEQSEGLNTSGESAKKPLDLEPLLLH